MRHNLKTGETTVVADSYQGKQLVSTNDLTSDAQGRIYFTDARYGGNEPFALPNAIYRVDPNGRITQLASDILRPNGIEVSPDGKHLYVSASNTPSRSRTRYSFRERASHNPNANMPRKRDRPLTPSCSYKWTRVSVSLFVLKQ